MPLTAITREVSPSMDRCELTHLQRQSIDLARAREQHAAYCACLRALGANVITLPAEPDFPDAVFVEDPAVVLDEIAVIVRPGAVSRQGEAASLARELQRHRPLAWMKEPATLDGGDVIRADRTLFVAHSTRTNGDGLRQLEAQATHFGYRVQAVPVRGCLHLKSAASYLGGDLLLIHRPSIDTAPFGGLRLIDVPAGEEQAANVLAVGETVMVAAGFPRTAELIEQLGRRVSVIDNSELRKAEGALTCCSLLLWDKMNL
ncbi:MAG TPA: arginine deiminase-related protein [Candidatus Acidoferrales bacterium]|nr:arginine deiminase-related protein [Candidatus Acidoferrales bacterium]